MVYNLTGVVSNSTTTIGFIQGINSGLMFGWLGVFLLLALTVVLFGSFYFTTQETGKSVAATSFIIFGLSTFLRALGLISPLVLYITLIIAASSIAFTFKKN